MITDAQRRTLVSAVARILPAGGGPGAVEAGAAETCEKALADAFFCAVRPFALHGLDALQAEARERFGRDFAACSAAEQDALLQILDKSADWQSRLFFQFLISQALEGFLGDPVHGGNRDALGWHFIGYDADRVRSGLCLEREGSR